MAGPFGSTLGLGTTGAARGAQNQQVLEQGRYRLAEMQRAEEEAQRSALARQLLLSNLAPLGQVPEGPLFPEQTFTARPDAPIPVAPVAAAPVAAAPVAAAPAVPTAGLATKPTGSQIAGLFAKEFEDPANQAAIEKYAKAVDPYAGTPMRAAGDAINARVANLNAMREAQRAAPNRGVSAKGAIAPAYSSSVSIEAYTKDLAKSLTTPAPGVATPATTAAAATPVVQAVESPITKDPPASSTTSNYLSNPGIIPAELNRATRARNDMVQIANALYSTLQSGSDAYLPQYLDMRAKINQMDSQLFLLGASEGLINLKMGDASLLSNVISAARGVPFQIVDRKDNDNFDVYIGDQLAGANVTFDELEKDARLFVDNAYRSAWAQSMAERDQMLMEAQLKLANDMTLEEFKNSLATNKMLAEKDADLIIEGVKAEVEMAKLGKDKADFNTVNGADGNIYFYAKDGSAVYRAEIKTVGKGKNATTSTQLVPVPFIDPLLIGK